MLMVIFGAGASFDAIPSRSPREHGGLTERLPLANDLFADRFMRWANDFPECKTIIPYLRQTKSVESELERLQREEADYPERRRQLTALRFYLQVMISRTQHDWLNIGQGVTNYLTLLDSIQRLHRAGHRTLLVTFNYDTMIEHALRVLRVQTDTFERYISNETFKLIKLHGSIDWGREIESPALNLNNLDHTTVAKMIVDVAIELKTGGSYHKIGGIPPYGFAQFNKGGAPAICPVYPALAIPVETKTDFECPPEHLEALKRLIPSVSKILVVGWRGAENHFLALLSELPKSQPPVMLVSPDAQETADRMRQVPKLSRANYSLFKNGFTEFVASHAVDEFLKD